MYPKNIPWAFTFFDLVIKYVFFWAEKPPLKKTDPQNVGPKTDSQKPYSMPIINKKSLNGLPGMHLSHV